MEEMVLKGGANSYIKTEGVALQCGTTQDTLPHSEELLHDPRELRGCYGENSASPPVLPCQFPFK